MARGPIRGAELTGWLLAGALVLALGLSRYEISIEKREPASRPVSAAALALSPVSAAPTPSTAVEDPRAPAETLATAPERESAEEPVAALEALLEEAAETQGAGVLDVERRLVSAEREVPSDFRVSYARARLSVYGKEHHEAFFHLGRAAEKAIRTEQTDAMLAALDADCMPGGALRRLAVGHPEWKEIETALKTGDPSVLTKPRKRHAHAARPSAAGPSAAGPSAAGPSAPERRRTVRARPPEPRSPLALGAALLEADQPCQALVALEQTDPRDPRAAALYHEAQEACLR